MVSHFGYCFTYTVGIEKGFVNDPADHGGATKYGITAGTLTRWRKQPVSVDDVRELSLAEAESIYRALYWTPICGEQLVQLPIAIALFDTAVLFGVGVSTIYAQQSLVSSGMVLAIDGTLGARSVLGLNTVTASTFLKHLHELLTTRIAAIVAKDPGDTKFRNGWEKRVDRFLTLASGAPGKLS